MCTCYDSTIVSILRFLVELYCLRYLLLVILPFRKSIHNGVGCEQTFDKLLGTEVRMEIIPVLNFYRVKDDFKSRIIN